MMTGGPVLLVPFQDPVNVGAVVRSAAAFGVRNVVLLREAATPFHPKSIRAGGSTVFLALFHEGPSIRDIRETFPGPVVALSMDGEDIDRFEFPETFALLPGMEGQGLPEGIEFDHRVRIPMEPEVESLNAAAATAVALYEWKRRKKPEKIQEYRRVT